MKPKKGIFYSKKNKDGSKTYKQKVGVIWANDSDGGYTIDVNVPIVIMPGDRNYTIEDINHGADSSAAPQQPIARSAPPERTYPVSDKPHAERNAVSDGNTESSKQPNTFQRLKKYYEPQKQQ